jgi:hypothetical protein
VGGVIYETRQQVLELFWVMVGMNCRELYDSKNVAAKAGGITRSAESCGWVGEIRTVFSEEHERGGDIIFISEKPLCQSFQSNHLCARTLFFFQIRVLLF